MTPPVARMEHFARPTDLPGDMTDWLDVFAPHFDALLPGDEIANFHAEVAQRVRQVLYDTQRHTWWVDYVRLRFYREAGLILWSWHVMLATVVRCSVSEFNPYSSDLLLRK